MKLKLPPWLAEELLLCRLMLSSMKLTLDRAAITYLGSRRPCRMDRNRGE